MQRCMRRLHRALSPCMLQGSYMRIYMQSRRRSVGVFAPAPAAAAAADKFKGRHIYSRQEMDDDDDEHCGGRINTAGITSASHRTDCLPGDRPAVPATNCLSRYQ
mmetsp:Transcript_30015/g.87709  ORF Transcript_30015/g.87709 Transcript_30015/m.87709 type:complete len:105 (+) Transcript_30015:1114-1428(+)